MAELSGYMRWVLGAVTVHGSKWEPIGVEGPRRPGHCNRCGGQCWGCTTDCELRVWNESTNPLKDPRK